MSPEEWAFKISELIKEAEANGMEVELIIASGRPKLVIRTEPPAAGFDFHGWYVSAKLIDW